MRIIWDARCRRFESIVRDIYPSFGSHRNCPRYMFLIIHSFHCYVGVYIFSQLYLKFKIIQNFSLCLFLWEHSFHFGIRFFSRHFWSIANFVCRKSIIDICQQQPFWTPVPPIWSSPVLSYFLRHIFCFLPNFFDNFHFCQRFRLKCLTRLLCTFAPTPNPPPPLLGSGAVLRKPSAPISPQPRAALSFPNPPPIPPPWWPSGSVIGILIRASQGEVGFALQTCVGFLPTVR